MLGDEITDWGVPVSVEDCKTKGYVKLGYVK